MPIFEYRCLECDRRFEEFEHPGARRRATCPSCGAAKIEKLLSVFAAHGSTSGATSDGFPMTGGPMTGGPMTGGPMTGGPMTGGPMTGGCGRCGDPNGPCGMDG